MVHMVCMATWPEWPYGQIWPDMATYGHIWPHMASYGQIWPHMVSYGHARRLVGACDGAMSSVKQNSVLDWHVTYGTHKLRSSVSNVWKPRHIDIQYYIRCTMGVCECDSIPLHRCSSVRTSVRWSPRDFTRFHPPPSLVPLANRQSECAERSAPAHSYGR